jgi:endonuclease-3 related protein
MDDQKPKRILLNVYQTLFTQYGPQHWWPAEAPFEVIVGAILTQSAAWTNVEKAIANLKQAGALKPDVLRKLPQNELAQLIHSCGYYNAKARKLKAFVEWFGEEYHDRLDRLFSQDTVSLRRQLLGVYGIGEETADSILLYAGGKPIFVIDAYTRRIMERLGLKPRHDSYAAWQALFMANLPADARLFNEYHALLVRLAKYTCRTRPLCLQCCLNPATGRSVASRFPCRKNHK